MNGLLASSFALVTNLFGFAGPLVAESEGHESRGVATSCELLSSVLTLHEPVLLSCEIRNETSRVVQVNLGQNRKQAYLLTLVRPDGKREQLPQWTREGIARVGRLTLHPADRYAQQLLLNEWTTFERSGKYTLEVELAATAIPDRAKGPIFRGTFEIRARDEHALARTAAALATKIESSGSVEDAMEAAQALSYMRDPAAIAALERALRSGKMVESHIVRGLESIGNARAVEVLISLLEDRGGPSTDTNSPTGLRQSLARSALQRIEKTTADHELKAMIRRAI